MSNACWHSLIGADGDCMGGWWVFGEQVCKENDLDNALALAASLVGSTCRVIVEDRYWATPIDADQCQLSDQQQQSLNLLEPGDVLVPTDIADTYQRRYLFEKVHTAQQTLHLLRGLRRRPESLRGLSSQPSSLIGREKELKKFRGLLQQIQVDQGQVVGLMGPAGIGKSRLTTALRKTALDMGIPVIEGTYSLDGHPYQGLKQIVRQLTSDRFDTLSQWKLSEAETDFLATFLHPDTPIDRLEALSEDEIRQGIFFSVKTLIARKTQEQPLVICLEDLHWADPQTIAFLDYLTQNIGPLKLLLLLIHRPTFQPPWYRILNYHEMNLSPFEPEEIKKHVLALTQTDFTPHHVLEQLNKLSLGVPFFIEELLRHFTLNQQLSIIQESDGTKILQISSMAGLPHTLHNLISARLDALPPNHKEALRWACVLGAIANTDELLTLLQEHLGLTAPQVLDQLFSDGYLLERSAFPQRMHGFAHDLVYEAIANTILPLDLTRYHRQIGWFLTRFHHNQTEDHASRIAQHFLKGEEQQPAFEYAFKAGQQALTFYHYPQACQLFQAAKDVWKNIIHKPVPTQDIYQPLISTLISVGQLQQAHDMLHEWQLFDPPTDNSTLAHFLKLQMKCAKAQENYSEVIRISDRLASLLKLELIDSDPTVLMLHYTRLEALSLTGNSAQVIHEGLRILRKLNDLNKHQAKINVWSLLSYVAALSCHSTIAFDYLQHAHDLLHDAVPPQMMLETLKHTVSMLTCVGELCQAERIVVEMIRVSEQSGLYRHHSDARIRHAYLNSRRGRASQALHTLSLVESETHHIPDSGTHMTALLTKINILLSIGAQEDAFAIWHSLPLSKLKHHERLMALDIQALFNWHKQNYSEAIDFYCQAAQFAHNTGNQWLATQYQLTTLVIEAERVPCNLNALRRYFTESTQHRATQANDNEGNPVVAWASYYLAALNIIDTPNIAPAEPDPLTFTQDWLHTQHTCVAKIRWLDRLRQFDDSSRLRQLYRAKREELAQHVPDHYHSEYFTHPLFKVP